MVASSWERKEPSTATEMIFQMAGSSRSVSLETSVGIGIPIHRHLLLVFTHRIRLTSIRLRANVIQQSNNLRACPRFTQAGKDARDAVTVSIKVHIGHGVDRERNVEPVFVCLARCGLDADAGRDASDHNVRDAQS